MANRYNPQKIDLVLAKQLYESGMTQEEVAKKLGTTQKVIFTRFKKEGYRCRAAKKRNQFGENNDSWKGSKAGYKALHYRINNFLGKPKKCEVCGTTTAKRFEWANLTGNFEDLRDYKRMCKRCHHNYDIKSHRKNEQGKFVGGDAKCV